eukprot:TRINITY_DN44505_c0_g1_i1.p1 TRINITY_DN44505_c0_g1~~TRINITY_DN44505_c0_g1_i1.p1  ORF type:complete len:386 (+),score=115.20 TRINITY_DN44505_c0_g1_i1:43-1158(+)
MRVCTWCQRRLLYLREQQRRAVESDEGEQAAAPPPAEAPPAEWYCAECALPLCTECWGELHRDGVFTYLGGRLTDVRPHSKEEVCNSDRALLAPVAMLLLLVWLCQTVASELRVAQEAVDVMMLQPDVRVCPVVRIVAEAAASVDTRLLLLLSQLRRGACSSEDALWIFIADTWDRGLAGTDSVWLTLSSVPGLLWALCGVHWLLQLPVAVSAVGVAVLHMVDMYFIPWLPLLDWVGNMLARLVQPPPPTRWRRRWATGPLDSVMYAVDRFWRYVRHFYSVGTAVLRTLVRVLVLWVCLPVRVLLFVPGVRKLQLSVQPKRVAAVLRRLRPADVAVVCGVMLVVTVLIKCCRWVVERRLPRQPSVVRVRTH